MVSLVFSFSFSFFLEFNLHFTIYKIFSFSYSYYKWHTLWHCWCTLAQIAFPDLLESWGEPNIKLITIKSFCRENLARAVTVRLEAKQTRVKGMENKTDWFLFISC